MDDGCEMTYRCLACCVVHGGTLNSLRLKRNFLGLLRISIARTPAVINKEETQVVLAIPIHSRSDVLVQKVGRANARDCASVGSIHILIVLSTHYRPSHSRDQHNHPHRSRLPFFSAVIFNMSLKHPRTFRVSSAATSKHLLSLTIDRHKVE